MAIENFLLKVVNSPYSAKIPLSKQYWNHYNTSGLHGRRQVTPCACGAWLLLAPTSVQIITGPTTQCRLARL